MVNTFDPPLPYPYAPLTAAQRETLKATADQLEAGTCTVFAGLVRATNALVLSPVLDYEIHRLIKAKAYFDAVSALHAGILSDWHLGPTYEVASGGFTTELGTTAGHFSVDANAPSEPAARLSAALKAVVAKEEVRQIFL